MLKHFLEQKAFLQEPLMKELRKEYMLVDMHSHTCYSHDSSTKVSELLAQAKKTGIGVAITDHVQANGALEAVRQKKIKVIPGIEVLSQENKEVLIYFYNPNDLKDFYQKSIEAFKIVDKAPKSILRRSLISVRCMRPMAEIVEDAHQYSCVKGIPHPFTYLTRASHKFFQRKPDCLKKIDAVEIINSTLSPKQNYKARQWAIKMNKAFIAGSDAHMAKQLGRSIVAAKASTTEEFLDAVRKKHAIVFGNEMKRREALKNILAMNKTKRDKKW